MKRGLKILLAEIIFFSIFLLCSCQKNLGEQGIINVETEYEVMVSQTLTEQGGQPAISLKTIQAQECINSSISYQTISHTDNIEVLINDINVEGTCEPAFSFLNETIELDLKPGVTAINISLRQVIDNFGTLESNTEDMELKLSSSDGLFLSKSKIYRIQPNMRWGQFSSELQETHEAINDYIKTINTGDFIKIGDYGLFYYNQDEQLVNTDIQEEITNSFFFYSEESFSDFQLIIESFKEQDASLVFHATNFNGRTINIE